MTCAICGERFENTLGGEPCGCGECCSREAADRIDPARLAELRRSWKAGEPVIKDGDE